MLLDTEDNDVLLARITSQYIDTDFDLTLTNWRESGLLLPSYIRLHKLATLEMRLIEKRLGSLAQEDLVGVAEKLSKIFNNL